MIREITPRHAPSQPDCARLPLGGDEKRGYAPRIYFSRV